MACADLFDAMHDELLAVAEEAARLAILYHENEADDEYVIRSAIINTLINKACVPPAILAHIVQHTRALIKNKTTN